MGIIKKFYITKFKKERPKIELKNRSIVDKFAKKLRNKKEINKKKPEHLYEFKIFKERTI